MRLLCIIAGTLFMLLPSHKALAATLLDEPPFVITISFDRILTVNEQRNTRTGTVTYHKTGTPRSFKYRFRSDNTSYFFQSGNYVDMEGPGLAKFGKYGLTYDFDKQAGSLDFGISFPASLVFDYRFSGTTGSYYFDEEDFNSRYIFQRGILRNVSVEVTAPAAGISAVPLPASLPLLAAGLLAFGVLRRKTRG